VCDEVKHDSVARGALAAAALFCAELFCSHKAQCGKPLLEEIATRKTRVIDLSYALSDKLVPWPGDAKAFEAKVNATVEKNGYFTRSFWMPGALRSHMDAPAHFPAGERQPSTRFLRKGFLVPASNSRREKRG